MPTESNKNPLQIRYDELHKQQSDLMKKDAGRYTSSDAVTSQFDKLQDEKESIRRQIRQQRTENKLGKIAKEIEDIFISVGKDIPDGIIKNQPNPLGINGTPPEYNLSGLGSPNQQPLPNRPVDGREDFPVGTIDGTEPSLIDKVLDALTPVEGYSASNNPPPYGGNAFNQLQGEEFSYEPPLIPEIPQQGAPEPVDPISQLLSQKYQDLPEAPVVQREDQSALEAVAQLLYGIRQSRANPPEALPELERQLAQAEARRDKDYEINSRNANLKNQRDIQQVYLENKDLQSRRDSILKLLSQGKGKPLGVKEGSQAIESLMFAIQSERDPVRKEDLILLLDNTIQELKPNG